MKINRENWIFVTGKAGAGKTFWIKKHMEAIPPEMLYIYDYNQSDYQKFKSANLWNVQYGSQSEIEEFLKIVYAQGNCMAILEESDNYFQYPSEILRRFVNTARNRGIGSIVNAKRAKSIKPVFRTRFNYLILFQNTLSDDIKYLEEWVGIDKGGLEILRTLKTGEHIILNLDSQEVSEVMKL
ncbi:MAG: hypothetical protein FIB08_04150 [Candidatus Methanoperedens sp.]|nr:hypothetical protein [Candidatus Methanoperedens sp.]